MGFTSGSIFLKSWTGRRRDRSQLLSCTSPPPQKLEPQTLFTASHRPPMICGENRLEQKRQRLQQRLVSANLPVVGNPHIVPFLPQSPDTASIEVAPRVQTEATGIVGVGHSEFPPHCVREPALRVQVHNLAHTLLVSRFEHARIEINRRPPPGKSFRFTKDFGGLAYFSLDSPMSNEVIVVVGHLDLACAGFR